ncbi:MAG: formylglycine-generating enzyme family protein, partial [Verrucomicrobia bacterium]|nr:formylglycine-generating enzyme family protein [Verrucomicrobiota bacterium]
CLDFYGDYPASPVTDPTGPSTGSDRVVRGGGWDQNASCCRSAYRNSFNPDAYWHYFGFRVALAPVQ